MIMTFLLCCLFQFSLNSAASHFALFTIFFKKNLPENHTLDTPECPERLLAHHQSLSFPLGTLSIPTTHSRGLISLLSSGPLLYSHAGKSVLLTDKVSCKQGYF